MRSQSLSLSGRLSQTGRNPLKAFVRHRVHETDRHPRNIPPATAQAHNYLHILIYYIFFFEGVTSGFYDGGERRRVGADLLISDLLQSFCAAGKQKEV